MTPQGHLVKLALVYGQFFALLWQNIKFSINTYQKLNITVFSTLVLDTTVNNLI